MGRKGRGRHKGFGSPDGSEVSRSWNRVGGKSRLDPAGETSRRAVGTGDISTAAKLAGSAEVTRHRPLLSSDPNRVSGGAVASRAAVLSGRNTRHDPEYENDGHK